jgi:hypothetical protein
LILPVSSASNAYNVSIQDGYVKATALCSCGLKSYTYHTGIFEDYCPLCHHHGTFTWNPKGTGEGEWTCSVCGADYCAADGRCKCGGSEVYLTEYVIPKPLFAENAPTQQKPEKMMFERVNQFKDVNMLKHH